MEPSPQTMNSAQTKTIIFRKASAFLNTLPKKIASKCLLTGGSAAFLYGSDRPFSDDIDFMVPKNQIKAFEKELKIKFEFRRHKPVFHSLAAAVKIKGTSYDLIGESIVKPLGQSHEYGFSINRKVLAKKQYFKHRTQALPCVPKELLVLIKLLAGRGKELKKYDLYDAQKILEKNKDFDFTFFGQLIRQCCPPERGRAGKPVKSAIVILKQHAKRLGGSKNVRRLRSYLESLQ